MPNPSPHFEARIRMFTEEEGGRTTPLPYGARPTFAYEIDNGPTHFMIWPISFGVDGRRLTFEDGAYPVNEWFAVGMFILSDEYRLSVHRERLRIGTGFFVYEGNRRTGEGVVTELFPVLFE